MSTPSDLRTLVLHGLRLKGFAEPEVVADTVAVAEAEAAPVLDALVADGLATHRAGRVSGFTLTPSGRAEHAQLLAAELDVVGARAAVDDAYRRFLGLNADLLAVCTDWQLRDVGGAPVANDHTDAEHDAAVIARLEALHAQVVPICADLAGVLDRFAHYGPRLSAATLRVRAGDTDWFTKPMIASYHTVWFELHEDLLATLGIERGAEVTA